MRGGGLVSRISKLHDRRGQPFAFITLEDMQGKGDVAFFSEAFAAHEELLEQDRVIMVEGRVTERNGRLSLQAEKAMPLEEAREQLTKAVNLELPYGDVEKGMLGELRTLCERHVGDCELLLHLKNGGEKDAVVRSRSIRVKPSDELLVEIDGLIGPKRTWLTMAIAPAPRPAVQEERRRWAS